MASTSKEGTTPTKSDAAEAEPAQTPKTRKELLEQERTKKLEDLKVHKSVIKRILDDKVALYEKLFEERIEVNDYFTCLVIWRNMQQLTIIALNPYIYKAAFAPIDKEIVAISETFLKLQETEIHTYQCVMEYSKYMKNHQANIEKLVKLVNTANSMKQMEKIITPKMDLIKNFPDSNIEELVKTWDNLDMKSRISKCYGDMHQQLRYINADIS